MELTSRTSRLILAAAIASAAVLASPSAGWSATGSFTAKDFLAADADWNVAANWTDTYDNGTTNVPYVPGSISAKYNDARISGSRIVTVSDDLTGYSSQLRNVIVGNGSNGTLNITATGYLGAYSSVSAGAGAGEGYIDVAGTIATGSASVFAGWINVKPGAAVTLSSQYQVNVNGGTLNFTGGTITDVSGNSSGGWRVSGGTVNHSAGTSTMSRELEIGMGGASGAYHLSGTGTINTRSVVLGYGNNTNGNGTLTISGGTLNAGGGLSILSYNSDSTSAGLLEVSGGSVTVSNDTRVGNPNNTGTGTLRVVGHQGTLTLGNIVNSGSGNNGRVESNNNAPLIVWDNGTLNFVIGADGVSTLDLTSSAPSDSRSVSYLGGTLDMDLMSGFTPTLNQTFDLVTTNVTGSYGGATGMDITGLTLAAADTANWTFGLISHDGLTTLQATYIGVVPEPASVSLLALGALTLTGRRRRN